MRLHTMVLVALLGGALATAPGCTPSAPGDPRPKGTLEDVLALGQRDDLNVVFILIDTLRADHLSTYGYERETSPVLTKLASTGVRFANNVSQSSWTKCSMASLWTGIYPSRTGVLRAPHVVAEGAKLPAEIFKEAGFRTAGIWRNGWIAPNFGFGQGFETYTQPKTTPRPRAQVREAPNLTLPGSDADIMDSTMAFLRTHGHERFFLYLHMMDVHQYVYSQDEALFGTSYLDIYDNSIRWVDGLIGHLLDELIERNLLERTIVVVASDHGEAFGEHGGEGHARNVYGEVTETPFIISFPFQLEEGIVVESRTANVDLWPTVLELVGLPSLPDPDGRSLVPEIAAKARGEASPAAESLAHFAELDESWGRDGKDPQPLVAVNRGNWRLIYPYARPKKLELYDKELDPAEQKNLLEDRPEVAEELEQVALQHLDPSPAPWGEETPSIELDDMQINQLRALGYGVQ